ncbi:growth hormone receptor a [Gouania willdenowi]|uniref:Growth hormone receptor-like n=1 Tax=Gouania willdenowi TaxID=441366 RepID=A0A8C5E4Z1_GOUWI|nr:growth hormone receptor-like [Gouania willdenowi]
MAPTSSLLLRVVISSLVSTPGWTLLSDWTQTSSSAPLEPHFTDCVSREQETFRCWWSPGIFQNLSSPGDLRVFYLKKESLSSEWKECPEYIHSNRECFFDRNHTAIWITYCMQLRSQNTRYINEDDCFTVENIVRPDPPVSLNWTLLNVSPSGLSYDVVVIWTPPPSADVRVGWMRIEYEVQYREINTTNWEALEVQPYTKQTIYGLHVGKEYEVHIRCKMQGFSKYGDFSDSIFIQVTDIVTEEPLMFILVLVLGIVGVLILIMLIAITQQHRLMMILLPPVPAPKIKGIDSELLKKGKLDDLNFFLNGGGFGGLPPYAPEFYHDEPWVEFIEVEAEDRDGGGKDDSLTSDTQMLLGLTQTGCHHINLGCSNALGFPNNNLGQTSCYDPAVLEANSLMLMGSLLPGQPEEEEEEEKEAASFNDIKRCPTSAESDENKHNPVQPTWINTDFYAQVSNVMPSGGVVLSPGQHVRTQESSSTTEEETRKKENIIETEEKKQTKLLVVNPEGNGYTVENIRSPPPSTSVSPTEYQTVEPSPMSRSHGNQSANIVPDPPRCQIFTPVADYTVVQELDSHRSLILQPPPPPPPPQQSLPSCVPLKVPIGYITPDLLGSLSP